MAFVPLSQPNSPFRPDARGSTDPNFQSGLVRSRPPEPESEPELEFIPSIPEPEPEPEPELPPAPPIDVEAVQQQAFQAGRESALAEVREQVARLESEFAILNPLIDELSKAHKRSVLAADDTIATLVLALARRIAGESLVLHPDAVPNVVSNALERMPEDDEIWIRVPPHTAERVAASVNPKYNTKIVPDPELVAGAVVETRHARIDATLDAATAGVAQAIRAWLESRQ